ncbi:MAG: SUMF1/EgtB/PvdO family nonheme iron enzyme [Planctomycetes bacterium]|nr:SUMF1/EgtB/PvdO family nonheme iron enzyme [Planctomycetota bacterium]
MSPPNSPETIDKYRVVRALAPDGPAAVYEAEHPILSQPYIIKVIQPAGKGARDPGGAREVLRQAGSVHHPGLVPVRDSGLLPDGAAYLAYERPAGQSLRSALEAEGSFTARRVGDVAAQVLDSLEAAHARGLAHRLLEPERVYLEETPDGALAVRLGDLGLAGLADLCPAEAGPRAARYATPEAASNRPEDARSDLYGVGLLLHEMLTGSPPFDGSPPELLRLHAQGSPPPASSVRPELQIPPPLEALVLRALSRDPARRPPDARAFRQALADALAAPSGDTATVRSSALAATPRAASAASPPSRRAASTGMGAAGILVRGCLLVFALALSGGAVLASALWNGLLDPQRSGKGEADQARLRGNEARSEALSVDAASHAEGDYREAEGLWDEAHSHYRLRQYRSAAAAYRQAAATFEEAARLAGEARAREEAESARERAARAREEALRNDAETHAAAAFGRGEARWAEGVAALAARDEAAAAHAFRLAAEAYSGAGQEAWWPASQAVDAAHTTLYEAMALAQGVGADSRFPGAFARARVSSDRAEALAGEGDLRQAAVAFHEAAQAWRQGLASAAEEAAAEARGLAGRLEGLRPLSGTAAGHEARALSLLALADEAIGRGEPATALDLHVQASEALQAALDAAGVHRGMEDGFRRMADRELALASEARDRALAAGAREAAPELVREADMALALGRRTLTSGDASEALSLFQRARSTYLEALSAVTGVTVAEGPAISGFERLGTNAQGYEEYRCLSDGATMVLIPAGSFVMGEDGGSEDTGPARYVHLDAFLIDKYEVTVAAYRRFCRETDRPPPEGIAEFAPTEDCPVVEVEWANCLAYARWAGKTLPTEAQWERTARGDDGRPFPWGAAPPDDTLCNFGMRRGRLAPVGSYPDGVSPYGVHDLAGNVFEWCLDTYAAEAYRATPMENPFVDDGGETHVQRGGSWRYGETMARSTDREYCISGDVATDNYGFRSAFPLGALEAPRGPHPTTVVVGAPADLEPLGTDERGLQRFRSLRDDAVLVLVPGASFHMGAPEGMGDSDELPRHRVRLDAFLMDRTEVTNAQFMRFVEATGHVTRAEEVGAGHFYDGTAWREMPGASWQDPRGDGRGIADRMDHPVVQVSWGDAMAYARWAGRTLPSEAQWELACLGTDGRPYPWGHEPPDSTRCNHANNLGATAPVGSYPAGSSASPYGLLDMAGNVYEWTLDVYDADYYSRSPAANPVNDSAGGSHVLRGGGFSSDSVRPTYRLYYTPPQEMVLNGGFRCARGAADLVSSRDGPPPTPTPVPTPGLAGLEPLGTNAQGYEEYRDPRDGAVMVLIPEGRFLMGSGPHDPDGEDDERPQRSVHLDAYWIDKYEVTVGQWRRFVEETGHEWYESVEDYSPTDRHPVVLVHRADAVAYADWAGRQLPTEAQWEKAARGTDGRIWPWGSTPPDGLLCRYGLGTDAGTTEVGDHAAGVSPYGVFQMAGNAAEWTLDAYDADFYGVAPDRDPLRAGETGLYALRGGGFDDGQKVVRTTERFTSDGTSRLYYAGLRCVRPASR